MKKIIAFALGVIFLSACSSSNDVASNKLFQKRKYQKGWHINTSKSIDKSTKNNNVAINVDKSENKEQESNLNDNSFLASENTQSPIQIEELPNSEYLINNESVGATNFEEEAELNVSENKANNSARLIFEEFDNITNNRQEVALENTNNSSSSGSDVGLILLIILAIILPPLAVYLVRDLGTEFYISLVLFLIAIGFASFLTVGLAGLAALVGLIYALLIVFDAI